MKRRGFRLTLFFLFLVSIGAAGYEVWLLHRALEADRQLGQQFEQSAADLVVLTGDLKAGLQAYVAAGQTGPFWSTRVSALRRELDGGLERLQTLARAPGTVASLDAAQSALQDLTRLDARVTDYLRAQEPLMASDLIFTDGQDLARLATGHLASAQEQERQAHATVLETQQKRQAYALFIMSGVGLLVALLLIPTHAAARRTGPDESTAPTRRAPGRDASRPDGVLGLPGEATAAGHAQAAQTRRDERLAAVATLCTDLSRVSTADQLPGLLERAAAVLDAAGLVVWLANPGANELRPVLGHGYPARVMADMGTLAADTDNVTAAAFRTQQVQLVPPDGPTTGAVVAPLASPAGCVGVLAAEIGPSDASPAAIQAVATILAAQLAPLLDPRPAARDTVSARRAGRR